MREYRKLRTRRTSSNERHCQDFKPISNPSQAASVYMSFQGSVATRSRQNHPPRYRFITFDVTKLTYRSSFSFLRSIIPVLDTTIKSKKKKTSKTAFIILTPRGFHLLSGCVWVELVRKFGCQHAFVHVFEHVFAHLMSINRSAHPATHPHT